MFKVVVSADVAFVNKYVYHIFLDYCALPGAVILNSMRYESIFFTLHYSCRMFNVAGDVSP